MFEVLRKAFDELHVVGCNGADTKAQEIKTEEARVQRVGEAAKVFAASRSRSAAAESEGALVRGGLSRPAIPICGGSAERMPGRVDFALSGPEPPPLLPMHVCTYSATTRRLMTSCSETPATLTQIANLGTPLGYAIHRFYSQYHTAALGNAIEFLANGDNERA